MGTTSSKTGPPHEDKNNEKTNNLDEVNTRFKCCICLDNVKDAVVGFCGHLFCRLCIFKWLEAASSHRKCPVCKAHISKDKVIPICEFRNAEQEDPSNPLPPILTGITTEPDEAAIGNVGFKFLREYLNGIPYMENIFALNFNDLEHNRCK
ncbi:Zinc finger, RING-type,Zinc finger, RING/FYVE/PHD-type,Zinc finger, RING-type, conserved site [Cinara cedri]|uniref:RING-type E3 ubiquitin transferase n=1 Tax=Cinara cedri TaxID=506608 RepID=A0A5E4MFV7_9HEMI|nr:Zinc finger, RING-type,Zinc finger, RING/FYVE/PHD-type,Zinc finger, RING-type, conserved site [Cinara cedri]